MIKAPRPANEAERLATLRAYKILDTPPEPAIDDLTFVAAEICQTKIAYVTLVDENRLWLKSKLGVTLGEFPRDNTFCGHTLAYDGVFAVADASADPRFFDHPLVARPDGIRFYAGTPLIAPNGCRIGLLCVMDRDARVMTEAQKQAFVALARQVINQFDLRRKIGEVIEAREAAVNAANFRARFLANMSHEIRTPMSGVLGMSSLLLKTSLNSQQEDYASAIRDSASGLLEIINDILDISKIEAGQLRLENIDFDLAALLRATMKTLSFSAQQKSLLLEMGELPEIPAALKGDPGRIRQILLNILGNAVKFTAQGSVRLELKRLPCRNGGINLHFSVIDTGTGIPAEAHARLFESFSQADDSVSRKFGGTGLGLAICKQLVERMGGEIGFESELGRGTSFWFRISFYEGVLVAPAPVEAAKPRAQLRPGPVQILVAEDNLINQKVIAGFLANPRFHVTIAENGVEAVEAASTVDYDLIFMDCHMPLMGGFDATAAIRRLPSARARRVPIIALTADSMAGDRERCLAAGMDDYLSKPITEKALSASIENWLGRAECKESLVVANACAQAMPVRFDERKLVALREVEVANRSDFVDELIGTFLQKSPEEFARLREAVEGGSYPQIYRLAHRLKASCGALGLVALQEKLATIEAIGRIQENGAVAVGLLEHLEKELPYAHEYLGKLLSRPRAA